MRGPAVRVSLELEVADERTKGALLSALLADADDRRFPFSVFAMDGGIRVEPAAELDAGDARAFVGGLLRALRAAEGALRAAEGAVG